MLMENGAYFKALRSSLLKARRSVVVLGWQFDPRTRLEVESAIDQQQSPRRALAMAGRALRRCLASPSLSLGEAAAVGEDEGRAVL